MEATLRTRSRSTARRPEGYTDRHREVLWEAMRLIAERGYAAASLRALARRLAISQPSLYHYFGSKEELVEQIVDAYMGEILVLPDDAPRFESLRQMVRYGLDQMIVRFHEPDHVAFMRFMFAISHERPRFRLLLGELVTERAPAFLAGFVAPFVAGRLTHAECRYFVELVKNAMMLRLLNHCVLVGDSADPEEHRPFEDFVVDLAVSGLEARLARADARAPEEDAP